MNRAVSLVSPTAAFVLSALIGAVLVPATAQAWNHIDPRPYAWHPDDLPFQYYVSDECEETIPEDYCVTFMQQAHEAWEIGAPCASLGGGEYLGPVENKGFDLSDPRNTVGFNDPNQELEPGVLAANLTDRFEIGFTLDGTIYYWGDDSDIVFNNDVDFATHEEILAGNCQGRTDIRAVATHEVGHLYGMGHTCEREDVCVDPAFLGAVMYWTSPPCDTLVDLTPDDQEGINTLYGPSAQFTCSNQVSETLAVGNVPFELKCVVESEDFLHEVATAEWTFGDGNSAEGVTASNTYTEAGNYTVEVKVIGNRDTCVADQNPEGEWVSTFRKVGFVRACGLPDVEFSYEHYDGLTYEMFNQTDVSVFGCIQDIEWQVYKGDKASGSPIADLTTKAWEPRLTFPEDGTYTVVVNVGGPAGTSAASITIDAKDRRGEGFGCGCNSTPPAAAGGLLLGLVGLLGLRRRR